MKTAEIIFCSFIISLPIYSQIFTEIPYPPLPYPAVSAELIGTNDGFIVHGINALNTYNDFLERWGRIEIFFTARWNGKQYSSTAFLLDTARTDWGGFSGTAEVLQRSVKLDTSGKITAMWSKVREHRSDIPPIYVSDYGACYAFESNGIQKTGGIGSMNDQHAVGSDNQVYYVRQFLQPVDLDTLFNKFSRYKSSVYYHFMGVDGGGFAWIAKVGNGGFPEIKMSGTTPHIIWLESDSSGSRTFRLRYRKANVATLLPAVTLREYPVPYGPWFQQSVTQHPLQKFSWSVDSGGGLHCTWVGMNDPSKFYILHHVNGVTSIDSITSFQWINTNVRYESNGTTKILLTGSAETNGEKNLYRAVSTPGLPVSMKKIAGPYTGYPVVQRIFRVDSADYALLENASGPGIRLVRGIQTDSVTEQTISRYHSITGTSLVQKGNRIWIPGAVSGTPSILSLDLSDQRQFTDFHFPLSVGDEWHYMVTPHNAPPWEAYPDVHKAVKDTVMNNGKSYIAITSRFRSPRYYRNEGLRVYEYLPAASLEKCRFDFSKNAGDTVTVDSVYSHRTVTLHSITAASLFLPNKRKFKFLGTLGGAMDDAVTEVVDSIGISLMTAVGPQWDLVGAKLSGKTYGTLLLAPQKGSTLPQAFALSQNFPNPFNPSTTMEYRVPRAGHVTIEIFDLLGRKVYTMADGVLPAGTYTAVWNAQQFAAGIYFARMTAGTFTDVKKLTLIK